MCPVILCSCLCKIACAVFSTSSVNTVSAYPIIYFNGVYNKRLSYDIQRRVCDQYVYNGVNIKNMPNNLLQQGKYKEYAVFYNKLWKRYGDALFSLYTKLRDTYSLKLQT